MKKQSSIALAAILMSMTLGAPSSHADATLDEEILNYYGMYHVSGDVRLSNSHVGNGAAYQDRDQVVEELRRLNGVAIRKAWVDRRSQAADLVYVRDSFLGRGEPVKKHGELLHGSGSIWIYADASNGFAEDSLVIRGLVLVGVSELELADLLQGARALAGGAGDSGGGGTGLFGSSSETSVLEDGSWDQAANNCGGSGCGTYDEDEVGDLDL